MEKTVGKDEVFKTEIKIFAVSLLFVLIALAFCLWSKYLFFEKPVVTNSGSEPFYTVIIDAGHGGVDGGAEAQGVFEKDLNLQVALKIQEFLSYYNVQCVLTRDDDSLLSDEGATHKKASDLKNRVKVAGEYQNPIFVSIHMNKFPEEKYFGTQVFYSRNNPLSEALALSIQNGVSAKIQKDNKRQVKEARSNIFVLDRLDCPAVLIECGFMSNNVELSNLCNEEYQNKLAFIIASSIINFIVL